MKNLNIQLKDIKTNLLEARDADDLLVRNAARLTDDTVVTLKVNVPGRVKNTWFSRVCLRVIDEMIMRLFKPLKRQYQLSFAGNFYLYVLPLKAAQVKKELLFIETNHPLGRFVDCDVYTQGKAVTRKDLNVPLRTCFMCDDTAIACARNQKHREAELGGFMETKTKDFLKQSLARAVCFALRKEVFLFPKFGLVSHGDNGAHDDMNITHFLASIQALKPYMEKFVEVGFDREHAQQKLRVIGVEAEQAMFKHTQGVNTHKGAIFIFGCFLPFYTEAIIKGTSLQTCLEKMQAFIKPIVLEDFKQTAEKKHLSSGELIYQKYGLKGIRGEVLSGFKSIMSWYPNESYHAYQKLCAIMSRLDDTTIIKRHNYSVLKDVQAEMADLLEEKPFNMDYYVALSNQYKSKGISPGGSADLLALVFFLDFSLYLCKKA